ncbi:MAG TPA: formate dehydrogenase [Methylomirabilota bacterium]|nr:formate dehydrogenase [Methylomirabilota bacterium]
MKRVKTAVGRRGFLAGLFTGGGLAAALGTTTGRAAPRTAAPARQPSPGEPILFRRSAESERYYRTLYR